MKQKPWLENLFHPLVIGAMFGCIALSLADFVHLFDPDWNGSLIIAGCVLAALEANYSYRLIRGRKLRRSIVQFRVTELLMLFILLKASSYVGHSWADVLADLQSWPRHPQNVLDAETMVAFTLACLSWWASTVTALDLERIREPHVQLYHHVPPRESVADRFFWGGAALLIITGITRVGISALTNLQHPPVPGLVLNVLVYFLLGLVMLGQVQFTALSTQWQREKIKVASELPGRWVRCSLTFIGLAALIAFLLPTRYTGGVLETMATIVGAALAFFFQLALLIALTVLSALIWLYSLLLGKQPPCLPLSALQSLPAETGAGFTLPQWFRSLMFWITALGIVVYVIRAYLRDHPEILAALTKIRPLRGLLRLLTALWRRIAGLAEAITAQIPLQLLLLWERWQSSTSFRFFRLGALSPRERTLYYFLSILRRAGRQGFPRRRSQTPYEYDATLEPHLPFAQQEMDALTQAFVETRYSAHAVDRAREKQVRAHWKRVKEAVRALKRGG